jgi:hypothetical protein
MADGVHMSDIVKGLGEGTRTVAIDARKPSGQVVDAHADVAEAL